jgi:hypothetical protein
MGKQTQVRAFARLLWGFPARRFQRLEINNLFGKKKVVLTSPGEAAPTPRNQGTEVPLRNKKV